MTIESGDVAAEAGVAFFNTSGPDRQQRDRHDQAGRPARLGVVMSNSLQGAEAGVRRQVTLEKSLVSSGGVLFDDARGADGTATTTVRSGITAYGNLVGSRIVGPVTYTYGQRGVDHRQRDHRRADADRRRDRPDPSNPAVRAFSVGASSLAEPGQRRRRAPRSAAGNWWGCATAAARRRRPGRPRQARWRRAPAPLSVPAPTLDAAADRRDRRPGRPDRRPVRRDDLPGRVAADDFGVKSVALTANGLPVATVGHMPYEFEYTPAYEHIGDVVTLTATITDSSGQSSIVSTEVTVPAITTDDARHRQRLRSRPTLALTLGAARELRRLHARRREDLHGDHDRERRSRPPATRS